MFNIYIFIIDKYSPLKNFTNYFTTSLNLITPLLSYIKVLTPQYRESIIIDCKYFIGICMENRILFVLTHLDSFNFSLNPFYKLLQTISILFLRRLKVILYYPQQIGFEQNVVCEGRRSDEEHTESDVGGISG